MGRAELVLAGLAVGDRVMIPCGIVASGEGGVSVELQPGFSVVVVEIADSVVRVLPDPGAALCNGEIFRSIVTLGGGELMPGVGAVARSLGAILGVRFDPMYGGAREFVEWAEGEIWGRDRDRLGAGHPWNPYA